MKLTREQIEVLPDEGRADFCVVKLPEGYYRMPRRFCDLALSAFDMRERAAKVCEDYARNFHGLRRDVAERLAENIRALPIPEGAAPEKREPAE